MVLIKKHSSVHGDSEPADSSDTAKRFGDDDNLDSASSTPYTSAPSSPGRGRGYFFFSAPASPMHFVLCSAPSSVARLPVKHPPEVDGLPPSDFAFDFSSPLPISASVGAEFMSSADELFLNGQIKPIKHSSRHQRQVLAPLIDIDGDEEEEGFSGDGGEEKKPIDGAFQRRRDLKLRSKSVHRRARSLSPPRDAAIEWNEDEECTGKPEVIESIRKLQEESDETKQNESAPSTETTPSCSTSSSRSSSSGRNSKKWIFLKDLLHRSKSEGSRSGKEKFWTSISFSPSKERKNLRSDDNFKAAIEKQKQFSADKTSSSKAVKLRNGVTRRRSPVPSAHELHYTANRAHAEEMKKRTNLPYRPGLFGCLGFSSKGYSALNGLARSLNPVTSSR